MKLKKNKAQCLNCLEIIESKDRHDFVCCKCYIKSQLIIDSYTKKKINKKGIWTSAYSKFIGKNGHGIYIDGGKDYCRVGAYKISEYKSLCEYYEEKNDKNNRNKRNTKIY